jgi:hypothetical protein
LFNWFTLQCCIVYDSFSFGGTSDEEDNLPPSGTGVCNGNVAVMTTQLGKDSQGKRTRA